MNEFVTVVLIEDGVIANNWLFKSNGNDAEKKFETIAKELAKEDETTLSQDDIYNCLDNGFYESDCQNKSVCISSMTVEEAVNSGNLNRMMVYFAEDNNVSLQQVEDALKAIFRHSPETIKDVL